QVPARGSRTRVDLPLRERHRRHLHVRAVHRQERALQPVRLLLPGRRRAGVHDLRPEGPGRDRRRPQLGPPRARGVPTPRVRGTSRDVKATAGRIRVGTASWTEKTLVESGAFYPRAVRSPEQRLRFYAERFGVVEVDATYYAL